MTQDIIVPALTRVEGESALYIRTKEGIVDDIELNVNDSPRFFEGLLVGRYYQEVPDITARICGTCPVSYQMSAARALENTFGIQITEEIRHLRRLSYCAEYIQSHTLHIYMRQAPDLLGQDGLMGIAAMVPEAMKKALRLRKIGNEVLSAIGGRSVHPVNTRVGGFYRWPDQNKIKGLLQGMKWAVQASLDTVQFAAALEYPDFERDYEFVSMTHPDEYAIYDGEVLSSKGNRIHVDQFETVSCESQAPQSTAVPNQVVDGPPYFVGPLARFNNNFAQLRPIAKQAVEEIGVQLPLSNPYKSLIARAVELVEVCDLAVELIESYDPKGPPYKDVELVEGQGYGISEAPRGILYHHYKTGVDGLIQFARITAPTAQNFARMEADLWELAPQVISLPRPEASLACEHLIRAYDPCFPCAIH